MELPSHMEPPSHYPNYEQPHHHAMDERANSSMRMQHHDHSICERENGGRRVPMHDRTNHQEQHYYSKQHYPY